MTQHTPGPWHVSQHSQFVRKSDGDWPAWNICDMNETAVGFEANARLIAAAPDLLAALQKAEISLSVLATEQARSNKRKRAVGLPEATNHINAWNEIRTAIRRAEGKTDE